MNPIILQYIIVAVMVLFAVWSLFKIVRKNFAPKKFSSKRTACDKDCGCS